MGHPMPPRTTQKSCKAWPLRQKSQIEPWLAHRPQILLVGVSVWHRQFDADIMHPTQTLSAALLLLKAKDHRRRKGLNDENYLSPASWEKCFLLTFPFIEPAQGTPGNRHRLRRGMRRGLYRKIAQFRLSPFCPVFPITFQSCVVFIFIPARLWHSD